VGEHHREDADDTQRVDRRIPGGRIHGGTLLLLEGRLWRWQRQHTLNDVTIARL
jgi:hypothetical protein